MYTLKNNNDKNIIQKYINKILYNTKYIFNIGTRIFSTHSYALQLNKYIDKVYFININ